MLETGDDVKDWLTLLRNSTYAIAPPSGDGQESLYVITVGMCNGITIPKAVALPAYDVGLRYSLTFFNTTDNTFVGRTYKSRFVLPANASNSGQGGNIPKRAFMQMGRMMVRMANFINIPAFVVSKPFPPSLSLVIELSAASIKYRPGTQTIDTMAREISLGWCKVDFNSFQPSYLNIDKVARGEEIQLTFQEHHLLNGTPMNLLADRRNGSAMPIPKTGLTMNLSIQQDLTVMVRSPLRFLMANNLIFDSAFRVPGLGRCREMFHMNVVTNGGEPVAPSEVMIPEFISRRGGMMPYIQVHPAEVVNESLKISFSEIDVHFWGKGLDNPATADGMLRAVILNHLGKVRPFSLEAGLSNPILSSTKVALTGRTIPNMNLSAMQIRAAVHNGIRFITTTKTLQLAPSIQNGQQTWMPSDNGGSGKEIVFPKVPIDECIVICLDIIATLSPVGRNVAPQYNKPTTISLGCLAISASQIAKKNEMALNDVAMGNKYDNFPFNVPTLITGELNTHLSCVIGTNASVTMQKMEDKSMNPSLNVSHNSAANASQKSDEISSDQESSQSNYFNDFNNEDKPVFRRKKPEEKPEVVQEIAQSVDNSDEIYNDSFEDSPGASQEPKQIPVNSLPLVKDKSEKTFKKSDMEPSTSNVGSGSYGNIESHSFLLPEEKVAASKTSGLKESTKTEYKAEDNSISLPPDKAESLNVSSEPSIDLKESQHILMQSKIDVTRKKQKSIKPLGNYNILRFTIFTEPIFETIERPHLLKIRFILINARDFASGASEVTNSFVADGAYCETTIDLTDVKSFPLHAEMQLPLDSKLQEKLNNHIQTGDDTIIDELPKTVVLLSQLEICDVENELIQRSHKRKEEHFKFHTVAQSNKLIRVQCEQDIYYVDYVENSIESLSDIFALPGNKQLYKDTVLTQIKVGIDAYEKIVPVGSSDTLVLRTNVVGPNFVADKSQSTQISHVNAGDSVIESDDLDESNATELLAKTDRISLESDGDVFNKEAKDPVPVFNEETLDDALNGIAVSRTDEEIARMLSADGIIDVIKENRCIKIMETRTIHLLIYANHGDFLWVPKIMLSRCQEQGISIREFADANSDEITMWIPIKEAWITQIRDGTNSLALCVIPLTVTRSMVDSTIDTIKITFFTSGINISPSERQVMVGLTSSDMVQMLLSSSPRSLSYVMHIPNYSALSSHEVIVPLVKEGQHLKPMDISEIAFGVGMCETCYKHLSEIPVSHMLSPFMINPSRSCLYSDKTTSLFTTEDGSNTLSSLFALPEIETSDYVVVCPCTGISVSLREIIGVRDCLRGHGEEKHSASLFIVRITSTRAKAIRDAKPNTTDTMPVYLMQFTKGQYNVIFRVNILLTYLQPVNATGELSLMRLALPMMREISNSRKYTVSPIVNGKDLFVWKQVSEEKYVLAVSPMHPGVYVVPIKVIPNQADTRKCTVRYIRVASSFQTQCLGASGHIPQLPIPIQAKLWGTIPSRLICLAITNKRFKNEDVAILSSNSILVDVSQTPTIYCNGRSFNINVAINFTVGAPAGAVERAYVYLVGCESGEVETLELLVEYKTRQQMAKLVQQINT